MFIYDFFYSFLLFFFFAINYFISADMSKYSGHILLSVLRSSSSDLVITYIYKLRFHISDCLLRKISNYSITSFSPSVNSISRKMKYDNAIWAKKYENIHA